MDSYDNYKQATPDWMENDRECSKCGCDDSAEYHDSSEGLVCDKCYDEMIYSVNN